MRARNLFSAFSVILILLLVTLQPVALAGPGAGAAPSSAPRVPEGPVASPAADPEGPPIRLRVGAFDPLAGEPAVPSGMRRLLTADRPGLRLIQFPGPIQDAWYQAILDAGLEVVTYIPDYAYLVWGDGDAVTRLAGAAPLRWAGLYHPYYALHPDLADPEKLPSEVDVIVQVYARPDAEKTVQAILNQAQATFRRPYSVLVYTNIGVRVPSEKLPWLASLPEVVNVEPYSPPQKLDEVQGQIMAGNLNAAGTQPSGPGYLAWIQSLGFSTNPEDYPIVDITDDGIDNGTTTPIHPDFYVLGSTSNPDRLVYNYNWTTDPSADGRAGHGNINASIAVGYNNRTSFPYEDSDGYNYGLGINPFGRVAGSKVFNNAGSWDTSATPTDLLQNTYSLGGRISSNSWGYLYQGGNYNSDCQEYDARVRDAQPGVPGNQEITVVFAAGNSGPSSNSVSPPGTAKNVIAVGAAENYRPTWTDGCGVGPTGADSAQDIASFSSRGPCDDQRTKPDIVAPGTHIEGAASQATGYDGTGVCDQYMPAGQTLYAASSGTSHSTPAVAGAASLVYYWYRTHYGNGQWPSPAMVKAYLTNATRYLTGSGAGGDLPSNSQGFGETLLSMAFDDAARIVVDQTHLFGATGQVYELQGVVADSSRPFRVTLAWSDPPGPTTGANYVNNLDLEVLIGGQTYKGNVFSGPTSVPGGSADPRNNVESVFLPAGQSGPFTIRVIATNIAGDGVPGNSDSTDQDFALVVYNGMQEFGYLDGTVYDGTWGGPLAGATVQAVTGTVIYSRTTDATGYFTATVAPDTYTVSAWKYGYTMQTFTNVAVPSDTVVSLVFTLTQTGQYSLTGQVTDAATGAPLSATVSVYGPFGDLIARTATPQETGLYTFTLYGGPYTVTAQAQLHQTGVATVALTADTVQNFALTATTTDGILWGYITSLETGNPVPGATVRVSPGLTSTLSGPDGYYELQLPSGTPYTVTVSAPLYSTVSEAGVVVPQSNLLRKDYALPTSHLVLTPSEGLSATLRIGKQTTQTLTVGNTGSGALDFEIREAKGGVLPGGGPDPFGYTYQDSRSADGPVYEWIDATDGTPLNLDDDAETNVTLPFPFTFYGTTSTAIRVGNNGGILFNATSGDLWAGNENLGTTSSNNLIVPFWDDIDSDTGNVYYKTVGTAPNRRFVIEWYNRPHYNNVGNATFELILYEGTNNIKFQYQDVVFGNSSYDYGASATVGIRGSGSNYLQYSYNQPVLSNGLAICFRYPGSPPCDPVDIPWLAVEPVSGTVASGGSLPVSVLFDTTSITETGVYTGFLLFYTNDPEAQPYARYPVTLTVLPPLPELTAISKVASAEAIEVGLPLVYTLTVTNEGGGPAPGTVITDVLPANTLFAWASDGGVFDGEKVIWTDLTIPARSSLQVSFGVTLTCVPSGTLIVNDAYTVTAADWPTPTTGLPVSVVALNEGVVANFSYGPTPVLVGRPVAFTNLSRNALAYQWDFGDGSTSTEANPTHTYGATGIYTVVLTATNPCNVAVASQQIQVENYALALTPDAAAKSGDPGQIVTYTLYLTNTGTLPDAFRLTKGTTTWATTLSTDTVSLAAGAMAEVKVYVTVPANAAGGAQASVRVTAQSQNDPRVPAASASVVLTTTANNVYGVALGTAVAEQTARPGETVTYTLRVTNTGNVADTFTITRTNTGWPTVIQPEQVTIARGGWREVKVAVTVPDSPGIGAKDVATIQAIGAGGAAEVTLTTRTPVHRVYLPLVVRQP
ncbi:MAG: S8 family serine peptidase [Thermoflexales bacterium]|nr:S8 family serine peptidase [Thermoflexales bacterium]